MQPSLSSCLGLCLPQEGALGSASEGGFGLAQLGSLPSSRQAAARGQAGVQPLGTAPLLPGPHPHCCLALALASTTCSCSGAFAHPRRPGTTLGSGCVLREEAVLVSVSREFKAQAV